jgi:hypothetical protein
MKTLNDNFTVKEYEDVKVVDNFFTEECLNTLKARVLYGKFFDLEYKNYLSINYFAKQDYLTDLIADEISKKFKVPEFIRGWSFIYLKNSNGVRMHADPSIVNVNVWVSSDESINDAEKNGLNIYRILPPPDWTREDWNNNADKSRKYILDNNVEPLKIKYKCNRAVFFNGAYFHETNQVDMKEGFENRRISYTLLFGKNLE